MALRFIFSIMLLMASPVLFAQTKLKGLVLEQITGLPIAEATISTYNQSTMSDLSGHFKLKDVHLGDTIRVRHLNYAPYVFVYGPVSTEDTILVRLGARPLSLNDVTIYGLRNYQKDSLNRRSEYASIFNYQGIKLKDVFIKKKYDPYKPYSTFQPSTSSILQLDVLKTLAFLSKNKNSVSKLQKTLLKEEEEKFVDQGFSKEKITQLTALNGEALEQFIEQYRPTIDQTRKMSSYEMALYIKESYKAFEKKE